MSIKFVCSCGKRLKARDEMAERLSICPRCGSLVGIPRDQPRSADSTAPLPRARRLRDGPLSAEIAEVAPAQGPARLAGPTPAALPGDPRIVRLLSSRSQRCPDLTGRHLEENWYECLLYPLRAWRLCAGPALIMTLLTVAIALLLPVMFADPTAADSWRRWWPFALLLLLTAGLPITFLELVLASAVDGEIYYIRWSGNPALTILIPGLKWLACFLAGPIVFAATAVAYWFDCGDAGLLDWLIMVELGIVAIAYQLFALLAVTDRGRLRDLNPFAVADLAHRFGWQRLVVVLAAAALMLAHGLVLFTGVATMHQEPLVGCPLLVGGWLSGVFCSTFFARLFGIWCHRSRVGLAQPSRPVLGAYSGQDLSGSDCANAIN